MKTHHLILCLVAAVGVSRAFGFTEFARGGLVLDTTARVTYDSRMFGGLGTGEDYYFTLDPRLIYKREAGQLKLEASAGVRFNRYVEFNELDSEDLVASIKLSLPPEGPSLSSGTFESSYDEHTEVNYDVNARIREETLSTRLSADVPIGLKTALLLGASLRDDERNTYSDQRNYAGTVGFRYRNFLGGSEFDIRYRHLDVESSGDNELDVPLDQQNDIYSATFSRPLYHDVRGSITYGYQILDRSEAEAINGLEEHSEGSIFSLGINGPFLPESVFPKVETSLSVGYQQNETPGINDTSSDSFTGNLHISWDARERTRVFFDARKALELTADDLTVDTTALTFGLSQSIGDFTTASISAGYEKRKYDSIDGVDREDDVYRFQTGARYRITSAWSAAANYTFRDNESNDPAADYIRHLVSVEATYRF